MRRLAPSTAGQRRAFRVVVAQCAVVVLVGVVAVVGPLLTPDAAAARIEIARSASLPTTTVVSAPTTTVAARTVPARTPLATPVGEISTYDAPDGTPIGTAGTWYGYPMTMPIVDTSPGWLRIMLPERPNGSTAWVRADEVRQSATEYRIVIDLSDTTTYVFHRGEQIHALPSGVGTAATPTPIGSFFVAVITTSGLPSGYGPVVLDTSGHSEVIDSWNGMGDAILSIHGPISAASDARIGTTGTAISNGCVRLHKADQELLRVIPLGTPVDVVA